MSLNTMQYVIKSKDRVYEEYAVFVAEKVNFVDHDVEWELSSTDMKDEATKFTFTSEALYMMATVGLHEDDWEVQVVAAEEGLFNR